METGLLNFHNEEDFATSIYDQGDFSGVDGQSSIYDMMHSDFQCSSDYTNQSAVHWDSDQEQEHNGDLAVLPVAPSETSSLNSSKEDYNKSLFEWQDGSLFTYQPLDPDVVCLDGEVIPAELPDNIFEDSVESNTSSSSTLHKPGPLAEPARCSTPIASSRETTVSSDASLNLDMSLSTLDVNVSDIDVSALGINVSSLDIKAENVEIESKPVKATEVVNQVKSDVKNLDGIIKAEETVPPPVSSGLDNVQDPEFAALFGVPQGSVTEATSLSSQDRSQLPHPSSDVEQLHDIAMEFIKEEEEAQAWDNLPLDCNVDLESLDTEVPVLEAGNLESLLEQFEATLTPAPDFSQSMPASPAHFSVPSPLSMPSSPLSSHCANASISKISPLPSPLSSPAKCKRDNSSLKKSSPSTKGVSLLHQNILESLPSEIMDRIKASGRKKTIPLIPAMPSKRPSRSGTRMHAAGAALSRNKLLKLVSRQSSGENVQLDHDYCSNDSSSNIEFVPDKLVMDIQANTKQMEWDEDKSRKDSGLESGEVSEDSEGAAVASSYSSGYDSSSGSRSKNSLLKPRTPNPAGRSKEMLMVSVLKKVRCDTPKSQLSQQVSLQHPKETIISSKSAAQGNSKSLLQVDTPIKSLAKPSIPIQSPAETVKGSPKRVEVKVQPNREYGGHSKDAAVNSTSAPIQVSQPIEKSVKINIKVEPPEAILPSETPVTVETKPNEGTTISVKPLEQPKKRKLNFEEYRNRLRAMEQKKENIVSPKPELPSGLKSISTEVVATNSKGGKAVNSVIVKEERSEESVHHTSNLSKSIKQEKDEMPVSNTAVTVADKEEVADCNTAVSTVVVDKVEVCNTVVSAVGKNINQENKNVKLEPISIKSVTIKQEKNEDSVPEVIVIEEDKDDTESKPERKQRQYRTRHMSTSSSDGSPQSKPVIKSRKENPPKKAVWSPSRSRSRSISSSSSRSASSNNSRSSSSSSNSSRTSSSSSSSAHSSGRRRRNTRRRRRRRSNSCSSAGSTRRGNSISSGSSRHTSPRRRSRSRSQRRSRRDRSVSARAARRSTSRGRNSRRSGWRRWRRDSTRSRGSSSLRRERCASRRRRGESRSSCSSSESRSAYRQRCTSRSRSRSRFRSRARRRYCSHSSRESRSRSRSSRSRSNASNCSRLQTRSRSTSRDFLRAKSRRRKRKERNRRSWRSRSPMRRNGDWSHVQKEHKRQIEERRVIYVGRIPDDTTKAELRRRFEVFGPIVEINLHFREHADNYGFVTFAYKVDAYEAVERGNDDPSQPHFELCFGGRRKFCRERYADLDGMACSKGGLGGNLPHVNRGNEGNSFDDMLREVQAKLNARKKL